MSSTGNSNNRNGASQQKDGNGGGGGNFFDSVGVGVGLRIPFTPFTIGASGHKSLQNNESNNCSREQQGGGYAQPNGSQPAPPPEEKKGFFDSVGVGVGLRIPFTPITLGASGHKSLRSNSSSAGAAPPQQIESTASQSSSYPYEDPVHKQSYSTPNSSAFVPTAQQAKATCPYEDPVHKQSYSATSSSALVPTAQQAYAQNGGQSSKDEKVSYSKRLTMPGQIHKAYKVILKLMNPKLVKGDRQIPLKIIKEAKGIAFVTVLKAGFIWSGTLGSGIVIARLPDGTWSGPSSLGVGGMGWGALIGASTTDSVIILNTDMAVKAFAGHGQIKFGGSLSVAAGPVGREGDASAHIGDGGAAACYSYSHSRGLFAGISLQGAIFMARHSDNERFYGSRVRVNDILSGKITPPGFRDLKRLHDSLRFIQSGADFSAFESYCREVTFRDATEVTFDSTRSNSSLYQHKSFVDDLDDDDDNDSSTVKSQGGFSSFAWGEDPAFVDDDEREFQKSMVATTQASKPEDLAPGWVQFTSSDGSVEPYYWHEATGKTQWERPKNPVPMAVVINDMSATQISNKNANTSDSGDLPRDWVRVDTSTGPYYWNQKTNVTQWEKPSSKAETLHSYKSEPIKSQKEALPDVRKPQSNGRDAIGNPHQPGLLADSSRQNPSKVEVRQAAPVRSLSTANVKPPLSDSVASQTTVTTANALSARAVGEQIGLKSSGGTPGPGVQNSPAEASISKASRPAIPPRPVRQVSGSKQPLENPFDSF